jgi:hypothetical protein
LIALPLIFALAFFVFGMTGFGSALVAMPLLSPLLGIEAAAPLFALVALTSEVIMLLRYRQQLNLSAVWRVIAASVVAIPLGITAARELNERLVLFLLGVLVGGYGLYGLISPHMPHIKDLRWGFGFGFIGGLLSGAYNTGGPPVVIYGNLSRWTPSEFKSNLQSIFVLNSLIVVTAHALSGHYGGGIFEHYVIVLPAMLIGLVAGWRVEKRVNPAQFRKLVLLLLVVIGVRLILGNV